MGRAKKSFSRAWRQSHTKGTNPCRKAKVLERSGMSAMFGAPTAPAMKPKVASIFISTICDFWTARSSRFFGYVQAGGLGQQSVGGAGQRKGSWVGTVRGVRPAVSAREL